VSKVLKRCSFKCNCGNEWFMTFEHRDDLRSYGGIEISHVGFEGQYLTFGFNQATDFLVTWIMGWLQTCMQTSRQDECAFLESTELTSW
jgi:hypothetical protein